MTDDSMIPRRPRTAPIASTFPAPAEDLGLSKRRPGVDEVDDLATLSATEIERLPFGYVALGVDGTVLRYNQYESDLARMAKDKVIGRNFFTEVAPCTQVREFEGRFRSFVDDPAGSPTTSFDFVFAFRHGLQNVRIALIRSPAQREIIMTVNRRQNENLSLQPGVRHKQETGITQDDAGNRVVLTNDDIWRALDSVLSQASANDQDGSMRVGIQWGMQRAFRVDRYLQRERAENLRSVSLGEACQLLSDAASAIGLGRFELDPSLYTNGLLVIRHFDSPFVDFFSSRENGSCALLAGFHAGQFSYMSGRRLTGTEILCSPQKGAPCRFVLGSPDRLEQFLSADDESSDGQIRAGLRPNAGNQVDR